MGQAKLNELNKLRKNTLYILYFVFITEFVLVYGSILLMSRFENGLKYAFWILILSIPMFVLTYLFIKPIVMKKYRYAYKTMILDYLSVQFSDTIHYDHMKGIDESEIDVLDLFNISMTSYRSEDLLTGAIHGINFKCADVIIAGTGKNNPQFYGQWYIFDFNKNFEGTTHIIEKCGDIIVGELSSRFHPFGEVIKTEQFKTTNKEFNDWFRVYTNDHHHALYILTPHFIERITKLESKHSGQLFMSFCKNKVHIGIHNSHDYLEPSLEQEMTEKNFDSFLKEINVVKSIVEQLNLNIKLFTDK